MTNIFDKAAQELKKNPPAGVPRKKSAGERAAERYKNSAEVKTLEEKDHLVHDGNSIHEGDGVSLIDPEIVRHNDEMFVIGDND